MIFTIETCSHLKPRIEKLLQKLEMAYSSAFDLRHPSSNGKKIMFDVEIYFDSLFKAE